MQLENPTTHASLHSLSEAGHGFYGQIRYLKSDAKRVLLIGHDQVALMAKATQLGVLSNTRQLTVRFVHPEQLSCVADECFDEVVCLSKLSDGIELARLATNGFIGG